MSFSPLRKPVVWKCVWGVHPHPRKKDNLLYSEQEKEHRRESCPPPHFPNFFTQEKTCEFSFCCLKRGALRRRRTRLPRSQGGQAGPRPRRVPVGSAGTRGPFHSPTAGCKQQEPEFSGHRTARLAERSGRQRAAKGGFLLFFPFFFFFLCCPARFKS